jgi:hypothetical protein
MNQVYAPDFRRSISKKPFSSDCIPNVVFNTEDIDPTQRNLLIVGDHSNDDTILTKGQRAHEIDKKWERRGN